MLKEECLQILSSVEAGEEINISTEKYLFFMYYLQHRSIQISFVCEVTGDHVKILKKEEDVEENHY